jgi:hypothetical protein
VPALTNIGLRVVLAAAPVEEEARDYAGVLEVEAPPEPEVAEPPPKRVEVPPPSREPPRQRSARIPKIDLGPTGATMQPWVRQTLFTEWYRENYNTEPSDDGFVALVNRTNLGQDTRTQKATIGTQVRLDAQKIWFPDGRECGTSGVCVPVRDDVRLERATLRIDTQRFSLYGGDFNVNMGRGLGLSVRKIDEIGVDATIKGGRFDLRSKHVRAIGIAGFANRQNSDFATRQLIPDPGFPAQSYTFAPDGCDVQGSLDEEVGNRFWSVCSDFVAGGRVEGTLPGKIDVGANYVYLDFGDEITAGVVDEYLHQMGGDIGRARIGGVWDTFVGASGILRNPNLRGTDFDSQRYDGWGVYSSNTFIRRTTTLLVEVKHYRDYLMALTQTSLMQYTENPTLEREDQQVPGNLNATGGRARLDHTWRDRGITLFANTLDYVYTENLDQSQFDPDEGRLATHNYAGIIWRKPKSDFVLQGSGGYRYERWLRVPPGGEGALRRKFPHAELYVSVPVGRTGTITHALNFRAEGRWETFVTSAQREVFFRGLLVLGWSASPRFSISCLQGIDTELPVPEGEASLTREACQSGPGSTCRPHLWPGVQVQVQFFDASFIRVFAGRQVGGRVCVNGSCRTLPDFEGVRSELVFSF